MYLVLLLLQLWEQSGLSKYSTPMATNFSGRTTSGFLLVQQSFHGVFNIQERGRCNHRDRRDCLQKPWRRGAQHGGQERPQVSKSQFWALPRETLSKAKLRKNTESFHLDSCRETDLNRTGQISLAEFKQMVVRWSKPFKQIVEMSGPSSAELKCAMSGKTWSWSNYQSRSPDFVNNFRIRI